MLAASSWAGAGCSGNSSSNTAKGEGGGDNDEGGNGPNQSAGGDSSAEGGRSGGGTGGQSSGGLSGGTAGNAGVLCNGVPNVCLDAQTVRGCNPQTGLIESFSCEEDVPVGLLNLGCGTSADGSKSCLVDVADPECWLGAQIFSVCVNATTDQELAGYYLGCFNDMNGAHTVIPCFIPFADEATLEIDCEGAAAACLPDLGEGGAGGSGEAGAPAVNAGAGGAE
jgi:hypothetical protein